MYACETPIAGIPAAKASSSVMSGADSRVPRTRERTSAISAIDR